MSESARKKKIGLFFGSFNPVHIGHMIIANYMTTQTDLDKVWLVVPEIEGPDRSAETETEKKKGRVGRRCPVG